MWKHLHQYCRVGEQKKAWNQWFAKYSGRQVMEKQRNCWRQLFLDSARQWSQQLIKLFSPQSGKITDTERPGTLSLFSPSCVCKACAGEGDGRPLHCLPTGLTGEFQVAMRGYLKRSRWTAPKTGLWPLHTCTHTKACSTYVHIHTPTHRRKEKKINAHWVIQLNSWSPLEEQIIQKTNWEGMENP